MAWLTVLGIPAAVYVMSMTALLFLVAGKPQNTLLLVGTGVLTAGIYIYHRTSIIDVQPMQQRHLLALRQKKTLLLVSWVLLLSAIVLFAINHSAVVLLVFFSIAGVHVYGRRTLIKPLRMFPYLKPLAVGVAITLLGFVLNDFSNSIITLLAFILICSADALVCDLVDTEYDSASGCRTLATQLGLHRTWIVATTMYFIASIVFLLAIQQTIIGLYLFIVFVFSLACRKFDSRYVVDLRPMFVLLLAWVECLIW